MPATIYKPCLLALRGFIRYLKEMFTIKKMALHSFFLTYRSSN